MPHGNPPSELAANGAQFSKFSINEDRPAKRRRNTKNPNAGPSATVSDASAGTKQPEKEAQRNNKDGSVSVAPRSCAECRRMKLKCDRVFPCKTCVRRGLEGICPEGSLVTGRGTRYVLASTEELHDKILKMADRIKTLEDALGTLHDEHLHCRPCSCQPQPPAQQNQTEQTHPLLRSELLLIKGQLELYGLGAPKGQLSSENASHPTPPSHTQSTTPLQNASRSSFRPTERPTENDSDSAIDAQSGTSAGLEASEESSSIQSSRAARGSRNGYVDGQREKETPEQRGSRLRAMLPPREEAQHLAKQAIFFGAWILNITSRPANRASLLEKLYDGPLVDIRAQDVALSLAAFALGERVDVGSSSSRSYVDNFALHTHVDEHNSGDQSDLIGQKSSGRRRAPHENIYLAKMALSEVLEPDQVVVHCLYLVTWYLAALSDIKDAGRESTAVVNLAVKIAFKIGMHLEETYVGLSAEDEQERRILFWALLHLETRLRLGSEVRGALGTLEITARRPQSSIPGAIKSFPTHAEALYHDYKLAFMDECVVPVLAMTARDSEHRTKEHDYYDVLALDSRIRDFQFPPILAEPITSPPPSDFSELQSTSSPTSLNYILNPNTSPSSFNLNYGSGKAPRNVLRMIRAKAQQEKLVTLLHLHRAPFYAHIRNHLPVIQRKFLPSALATFSVSCELIRIVKEVHAAEPELAARVSVIWYNAFLAAASLFMLVAYKPFCPVSVLALKEIERARNLFLAASVKCHMAATSYPYIREFYSKASNIFNRWQKESEGDLGVFGPNGEVTFCKTRIDLVIQRLQCVSIPSAVEEDATKGLLNLKTQCRKPAPCAPVKSCAELTPCESAAAPTDDPLYDMWQEHVHKELIDFVKRVPEVLRDVVVDPRRATAARLIWGFIPLPEGSKSDESEVPTPVEESKADEGLPSDFDLNAFTDALMHPPTAHMEGLGLFPGQFGLPSPPATMYSPDSSQSSFFMFDMCTDLESSSPAVGFKERSASCLTDMDLDSTPFAFGQMLSESDCSKL